MSSVSVDSAPAQAGWTMLELLIVMSMLAPMLMALVGTNREVTSRVDTTTQNANVASSARQVGADMLEFVRGARLSTMQVSADAGDVASGAAISTGEWIDPPDSARLRTGVRFIVPRGLAKIGARLETIERELSFRLDPSESHNGTDDDGDGLVDEGTLEFIESSAVVRVVRDVEQSGFSLSGRKLHITTTVSEHDSNERVHRATIDRQVQLRNN